MLKSKGYYILTPDIVKKRLNERTLINNYAMIVFDFKIRFWQAWARKKYQESQVVFPRKRLVLLKFLFSYRLFIGFVVYFKEHLQKYLIPLNYLSAANDLTYLCKFFISCSLHPFFSKHYFFKMDFSSFTFQESFNEKIDCTFSSNFFKYCYLHSRCNYLFRVVEQKGFPLKVPLHWFLLLYAYTEHLRLMKYNEYLMSHYWLAEDYTRRRSYVTLYYYWPALRDSLDGYLLRGFRQSLLRKYIILFHGLGTKKINVYRSNITERELLYLAKGHNFWFLRFLSKLKKLRNRIIWLNDQAVRNTIRVCIFSVAMKKYNSWRWFHRQHYFTLLDAIFASMKVKSSKLVFQLLIRTHEKKLFNSRWVGSYLQNEYFVRDLEMFYPYEDDWSIWSEEWVNVYWGEMFFYFRTVSWLITTFFSESFIRMVCYADGWAMHMYTRKTEIYFRFDREIFTSKLFYLFPYHGWWAEIMFGVDYHLWRIWYQMRHIHLPLDYYLITTSVDTIIAMRYKQLFKLFTKMFFVRNSFFKFNVLCAHLWLRDLFYKNFCRISEMTELEILNFRPMLILFFLGMHRFEQRNDLFYSWRLFVSKNKFLSIAPVEARIPNLDYATLKRIIWFYKLKRPSFGYRH